MKTDQGTNSVKSMRVGRRRVVRAAACAAIAARERKTVILITNDVDEAILLADRVVMMTNGPHAKVGKVMDVALPRPRSRKALLEHPDYYAYRQEVLDFLAGCERAKAEAAEAAAA